MGKPISVQKAIDFQGLVELVSEVIRKKTGNVITKTQLPMVESRLSRRLIELGRMAPDAYLKFLEDPSNGEETKLIGLLTTHHTLFFREFVHFEMLEKQLPELVAKAKAAGRKRLLFWSAACSRGQEVYSLAMFLKVALPRVDPSFGFKILGTDIDAESVEFAKNGVYHKKEIQGVPMAFLEGCWARGTGAISEYVRAAKVIREKCEFKVANLLDFQKEVGLEKFDVVFCRNVFIYFEQDMIRKIMRNMAKVMVPHGLFFSGLSESLTQLGLSLHSIGASVYTFQLPQNTSVAPAKSAEPRKSEAPALSGAASPSPGLPSPIRILAVDDSKTVHSLFKKIFAGETQFEIVGHAMNGQEAQEMLKTLKVDVVTLDIHMPVMDGLQYLQRNFNANHPPVVMVSSASREDSATALRSLDLGASDFVEKPSLQNLVDVADELKAKIKMALIAKRRGPSSVDRSFAQPLKIARPERGLRVVFTDLGDLPRLSGVFAQFEGDQPPTLIVPVSQDVFVEQFQQKVGSLPGVKKCEVWSEGASPAVNCFYVMTRADFSKVGESLAAEHQTSVLFLGSPSTKSLEILKRLRGAQVLLEDLPSIDSQAQAVASDIFPITSFAYVSSKFLSEGGT